MQALDCGAGHTVCTPLRRASKPAVWLAKMGLGMPDTYLSAASTGKSINQSMHAHKANH